MSIRRRRRREEIVGDGKRNDVYTDFLPPPHVFLLLFNIELYTTNYTCLNSQNDNFRVSGWIPMSTLFSMKRRRNSRLSPFRCHLANNSVYSHTASKEKTVAGIPEPTFGYYDTCRLITVRDIRVRSL